MESNLEDSFEKTKIIINCNKKLASNYLLKGKTCNILYKIELHPHLKYE